MHHLKSYQLISFQNRSLFLMITNTRLCCWQKLSSQSFGQNTQWLLKLKLARLKPVALTVDSILLAEMIQKKSCFYFSLLHREVWSGRERVYGLSSIDNPQTNKQSREWTTDKKTHGDPLPDHCHNILVPWRGLCMPPLQ